MWAFYHRSLQWVAVNKICQRGGTSLWTADDVARPNESLLPRAADQGPGRQTGPAGGCPSAASSVGRLVQPLSTHHMCY